MADNRWSAKDPFALRVPVAVVSDKPAREKVDREKIQRRLMKQREKIMMREDEAQNPFTYATRIRLRQQEAEAHELARTFAKVDLDGTANLTADHTVEQDDEDPLLDYDPPDCYPFLYMRYGAFGHPFHVCMHS